MTFTEALAALAELRDCQHDFKKPRCTVDVVSAYSGRCTECEEYVALDIPGDAE
jgi:hypothetical protein